MQQARTIIYLLAADVREDTLRISLILPDQLMHQADGIRHAALIGVIKRKPHSQHNASLETLPRICRQLRRIIMPTRMEQIRRDDRHRLVIK
ncbi:MAG: hypothetical protein QM703_07365 [Gemmatales bacterium]